MFAAERIKKTKEILREYRYVDVNTLCTLLDCSIATVRRDLDKLESEGFITKSYGGAILNESDVQHVVLAEDNDPYYDSKQSAAALASSLVVDGSVIYIGAGITNTLFAAALKSRKIQDLSVVTNSLNVASELSDRPDIKVMLLGGNITTRGSAIFTVGNEAVNTLSSIYIDKAFFSVEGISIDYGYTVTDLGSRDIIQAAMKQSLESCVIADLSKFGKRSLVRLSDVKSIHSLVTNVDVAREYKSFFFQNNVKIYTSIED